MRTYCSSILSLLLILIGTCTAAAQKPCPTNFDGKAFLSIQNKIKKHIGETIAFDGEVVEIQEGYNDIPYFLVKLDNNETLWIASMVSNKYVKLKAKLRLLGYIDVVKNDDAIARQYNDSGYQVRVFAMLDHATKQMQLSNSFESEVKEWVAGLIPKNRK